MVVSAISTLKKVISQTEKVVNTGNLCCPKIVIDNVFGIDMDEGLSLQGVVNSLKDSAGNVAQLATYGVCAWTCLWPPTNLLSVFEQVFAGVAKEAADIMDTIVSALEGQIQLILEETIGSVFAVFEAVLTLLDAIGNIVNIIIDIIDGFKRLGRLKLEKWWNDEECIALMSSLAACYLNKWLGPLIDDFQQEALSTIYEVGGDLKNRIMKNFDGVDEMHMLINREAQLLRKGETQLRGVHNLLS